MTETESISDWIAAGGMPPYWVLCANVVALLAVLYMVPSSLARPLRIALIESDAARVIAGFAAAIGFVVIVATAWQIWIDLNDRREERVDRAWNRLLRPVGGNTGKDAALNYLFAQGEALQELDISCKVIGAWNSAGSYCEGTPLFARVELRGRGHLLKPMGFKPTWQGRPILRDIKTEGSRFGVLRLSKVEMWADLEDTEVDEFIVEDSYLWARTRKLVTRHCRIVDSHVQLGIEFLKEHYCEVSSSTFPRSSLLMLQSRLTGEPQPWAMANRPPFVVDDVPDGDSVIVPWPDEFLEHVLLCDPKGLSPVVLDVRTICDRMSIEDAKAVYPEAYSQRYQVPREFR
ncbi:hypothetical protein FHT79_002366 [Rhizobium sp. BK212]|uniref:hypothetical protein n=1 Tax=Rhizobium sp. BK212 TaxID=2587074 RepID=UPI00160C4768|nr:hypothetical protein [Rhizobium sp. BK212]MBB4215197.1 hypothetical protein [Rhizobium sp. BK212]